MPRIKGSIPWNKGLTAHDDTRVKKYGDSQKKRKKAKRFLFNDQKNIINLYFNKKKSIKDISILYNCKLLDIKRTIIENGLKLKSVSDARKDFFNLRRIYPKTIELNNKKIKIINGFYSPYCSDVISSRSILELVCPICNETYTRVFHWYKKYQRLYGKNLCPFCLSHTKGNPKISKQQLCIHKLIGGKLNFLIGNVYVDICFPRNKIIVEYDGAYWHNNKIIQNKDRKRDEFLKSLGYRILRIKSNRLIPDKNELIYNLKLLKNGMHRYREIILKDWR
jgi:very-short-patch-repair endonuclease